jgi:hypothetical protein
MTAHAETKRRARAQALRAIRAGIDADDAAFRGAPARDTPDGLAMA